MILSICSCCFSPWYFVVKCNDVGSSHSTAAAAAAAAAATVVRVVDSGSCHSASVAVLRGTIRRYGHLVVSLMLLLLFSPCHIQCDDMGSCDSAATVVAVSRYDTTTLVLVVLLRLLLLVPDATLVTVVILLTVRCRQLSFC